MQSIIAPSEHDAGPIPIWRDPSPGCIGILLHLAGLLGDRHHEVEAPWRREHPGVCIWHATCPICESDGHVMMFDPSDCFAEGYFRCECIQQEQRALQRFDDGRYDELYLGLAQRLDRAGTSTLPSDAATEMREVAVRELELRLPQSIDIGRLPPTEVVAATVRTLARVPEVRSQGTRLVVVDGGSSPRALREPELRRLLLSVLHTVRNGKPCQVPVWLARSVLQRRSWPELPSADSEDQLAQAVLVEALREAVVAKGNAVTASELLQLSSTRVTDALRRMHRQVDAKALGYVLRELRATGGGVQDMGMSRGVTRWTVSSPKQ